MVHQHPAIEAQGTRTLLRRIVDREYRIGWHPGVYLIRQKGKEIYSSRFNAIALAARHLSVPRVSFVLPWRETVQARNVCCDLSVWE